MNENQTIILTDPAREIAELFTALQSGDGALAGSKYLATKFEVDAWSQEFYRIVSTIMDRLTALNKIIADLPIDKDYQSEMVDHVDEIAEAFTAKSFQSAWNAFGADKISAKNLQPIKGLSGLVRQKIVYRKLSEEEILDLVEMIDDLVNWLKEHQISQQDFIRQALIEGFENLRFRLTKLNWLGWGYALDSLREVITAYMLLERKSSPLQDNPDADAILLKIKNAIKSIYKKVETVKSVSETGDWLLKAYGAATLAQQALPPITGFLPNG